MGKQSGGISKPDADTYQMTIPTWYVNNLDIALVRIVIDVYVVDTNYLNLNVKTEGRNSYVIVQ